MNDSLPRMYRFKTREQWRAGLLDCIEARDEGTLITPPRYSPSSVSLVSSEPAEKIAANSAGTALWQIENGRLQRLDECGEVTSGDDSIVLLAASPRWIADRDSVWLADVARTRIVRLSLESLDVIEVVDVASLMARRGDNVNARILDIAGDGAGGVWILVSADGQSRVLKIDCHANIGHCVALGYGACQADQLAYLPRSRTFVLRDRDGERLMFFDANGEATRPPLFVSSLSVGWKAARVTDDAAANAIIIGSSELNPTSQAFIIDAQGERIEGPLEPSEEPGAARWNHLRDVSARAGKIWLASDSGVFTFQRSSNDTPEFQCGFLTPTLDSPEVSVRRGWLRAEIDARLPAGAVVEARFGWSKDVNLANELRDALRVRSMSIPERRALLWSKVPASNQRTYSFTANAENPDITIAVPLFEAAERFLWLELRIVAPPNSQAVLLRELRVIYPDVSLMERLPALYSDSRRDPGGAIRRIVGVLETTTQHIDERIRGIARLLDAEAAPAAWLDYLASWLDLPWDAALPEESKRALLRNAASLIFQRGTRAGLQALLDILFGTGNASFVDLSVDVSGARLSACKSQGARLPLLLPGAPRDASVLGEKTVLGKTRIICDKSAAAPLSGLSGLLRIGINTTRETRAALAPLLRGLLDRFLPAGVTASVRWRSSGGDSRVIGESYVLDGPVPARVGTHARVGNITLSGAPSNRLDDPGTHVRLRL